jgi:hypothetical protein
VTLVQDFVAFTIDQNAPIPGNPFDFRDAVAEFANN